MIPAMSEILPPEQDPAASVEQLDLVQVCAELGSLVSKRHTTAGLTLEQDIRYVMLTRREHHLLCLKAQLRAAS
jgi:hypothetical protein